MVITALACTGCKAAAGTTLHRQHSLKKGNLAHIFKREMLGRKAPKYCHTYSCKSQSHVLLTHSGM